MKLHVGLKYEFLQMNCQKTIPMYVKRSSEIYIDVDVKFNIL